MSQPARFMDRTRLIFDKKVSSTAKCLYFLLDEKARGADEVEVTQKELASLMDISLRRVATLLVELRTLEYLRIGVVGRSNVYEFYRKKTSSIEREHRKFSSSNTGSFLHPHLIEQENPREESSPTPPLPVISDEDEDLTPLSEAVAEHVPAAAGDLREIVTAARRSKPSAPVEEIALAVRMSVPPKYPVRHHRYFVTAVPRMIASEWFRNAVAARAAPAVLSCGEYAPYEEPDAQRRGVA